MHDIQLYGFAVSPHVRAARIAFHEKGVAVDFKEIGLDHLGTEAYAKINPFRKMPTLVHGDFVVFETPALLAYADAVGRGASLQPTDAKGRARTAQFIGVAQQYLYPVGVMQLYFQNVLTGLFGMDKDEGIATASVAPSALHLDVLETALEGGYLAGGALSLADLYCGAMVDYMARTKDGRALVADRPKVSGWLNHLRGRDSFAATLAPMLAGSDQ